MLKKVFRRVFFELFDTPESAALKILFFENALNQIVTDSVNAGALSFRTFPDKLKITKGG